MISRVVNKEGLVTGYIEWEIVNKNGQFEDNGEYIYIQDIWIHCNYRRGKAMKMLIDLIKEHKFSQTSQYVYWERDKYSGRQSLYKKDKF